MALPWGGFAEPRSAPRWKNTLRSLPVALFFGSTLILRIVPFVSEEGGFWWFYQHGWKNAVQDIVTRFEPGDLILSSCA